MSTAELKPADVFDPGYWYPAITENVSPLARFRLKDLLIRDDRTAEKVAKTFEALSGNNRTADRELPYGSTFDLDLIPTYSVLRFRRECLSVASHHNSQTAYAELSKNQIGAPGLVGVRSGRQPSREHYPDINLFSALEYEWQEGLCIVLIRGGKKDAYGVRLAKEHRIKDASTGKYGASFYAPQQVEESPRYRFESLKLPVNWPAAIGVSGQSVEYVGKGGDPAELCQIERINYVEVFDAP